MISSQKELFEKLPDEFCAWLKRLSKKDDFRCTFPINEVSPLEKGIVEDFIFSKDDVFSQFDPVKMLVHFGSNIYGSTVCISLNMNDYGYIYYYDNEERLFWPTKTFESFSAVAPQIKFFLEARDRGELPENELGQKNFYRVAKSFKQFLAVCSVYQLNDGVDDDFTDEEKFIYDALDNFDVQTIKEFVLTHPNWKNEYGDSLTQICAADGLLEPLKLLVSQGESVEGCMKFARNNKQKEIEEYLISKRIV